LTFSTKAEVEKMSNFSINGETPATFEKTGEYSYKATYIVSEKDTITGEPVPFAINVKTENGIQYFTVRNTSDKSSVTIVDPKPVISKVRITSNNDDPTKATDGNIVTLTFTADEPVEKLGNFKINGSNPDTFTSVDNVYTATHKVDEGDKFTGEAMTFQINVKNAKGIYSQTIEATDDESSVTVIDRRPTISNVSITSNGAKGSDKAANGDTITLTFTCEKTVEKLSNFKINGSNPDTFTKDDNVYTATHLVDEGDKITGEPATFQINVKDEGGIYSQTIEATNDGSSVTIVDEKPVISKVSISSDSAKGSDKATMKDTITLTFTCDEPIGKLGNFKINGSNPDTFTKDDNVYTATHLVDEGDKITGEPATFQINVKDEGGIYSQTIEATNDGSSVTIVDEKPVISNISIVSDNADPTKATDGNIVTLTFTADEPVEKLGNFKINGSNPDTFTSVGNVYTTTHKVDEGDLLTGEAMTFQINVKNANGIYSVTVEETNDGSAVTVYREAKIIYMDGDNIMEGLEPSIFEIGTGATLIAQPEKAGHTFARWYNNPELTGTAVTEISSEATEDQTLYAKWNEEIKPGIVYEDVAKNFWGYPAIMSVTEKGCMSGYLENGKYFFRPEQEITRAEFVTMLGRYEGAESNRIHYSFKDIDENTAKWAGTYISWATENKIVFGRSETVFDPNAKITRQEMAAMISRYLDYKKYNANGDFAKVTFRDKGDIADWAKDAVADCVAAKIINGYTDGTFGPRNNATRAQSATVLNLIIELLSGK
ncbi:MAG: S-layer homology domain-containing protein, partial [Clostridia bacterium]